MFDLIGSIQGFRRPGYVLSTEPGLGYMIKSNEFSQSVPIAVVRDRTQSLADRELQALSKTSQHGDAAFADYVVMVSYSHRF